MYEDPSSEEFEINRPVREIRRKTVRRVVCCWTQPNRRTKTVREIDQRRIPSLEKMSTVDEDPMSNVVVTGPSTAFLVPLPRKQDEGLSLKNAMQCS